MIDQGRSTIDELGSMLRSLGRVRVRLMMRRADERLCLVTGIVEAGEDSAGFDEAPYDYGKVAIVKTVLDGSTVADWLAGGSGEVDGLEFSLPELSPNCNWIRSASYTYGRYGHLLTVPHTEYSIISGDRTEQLSRGIPLAGVGRPFFPDETAAAASLLLDDHSAPANRSIPSDGILIRIAHPEAYIGEVRVSSAAITVSVCGEDLEGVHLQVSSAGNPWEEPVSEPGDVSVPISGADSADVWVSLVRGQECLDFLTISSQWPTRRERQGIVYEIDDLNERLNRLRLGGESETVEFKKEFPEEDGIPRTVAAFANGNGGTLILGIRDDGEVAGVGNEAKARDRLVDIVRSRVRRLPRYDLLTGTVDERTVIAMLVEPGDGRPYGVTGKSGIQYYIRRGATNRVPEPEELQEICQPRQSIDRHEAGLSQSLP